MDIDGSIALFCVGLPVVLIALIFGKAKLRKYLDREHRAGLVERFGSDDIVTKILAKEVWQGETSEMLIESLGKPSVVDQTVLKTKTKETWKYYPTGKGRYGLSIYLEDDFVIGWEGKNIR